jgi:hypothetical protein
VTVSEADPLSDQRIGVDLVRQDAYLKGLAAGRSERAAENEALTILAGANENTMRQWEGEAARLRAENEALKHVQQWRAVGVDSTEEGVDADFMPWRAVLAHAQSEASAMRQENDPPYDEVVIQTRWLSEPKRYVNPDEQHGAWDAGAAGRRAVEKHSDALGRLGAIPREETP